MKNTLKKLVFAVLLLLAPGLISAQQNTLTQTTLSAAIVATPGTQFSSSATVIQVASATNITGISLQATTTINQQNQTILYVDREAMAVVSVNGTSLSVVRGWGSTSAAPHATGAMVLAGKAAFFYSSDPGSTARTGTGISNVTCTAATVLVTPYVNILTGAQWICSTITSTWVPGWNNAQATDTGVVTTAVASAAGAVLPSGPLFHITGALAITGFTIPVGFNATSKGGGTFCAIPDAAFTTTAAGNIALASTGVVNKLLCWTWDATNSKFVPSY